MQVALGLLYNIFRKKLKQYISFTRSTYYLFHLYCPKVRKDKVILYLFEGTLKI